MHPVATAVAPLKADAIDRAEQVARNIAKDVQTKLDAGHRFILPMQEMLKLSGLDYERYKLNQHFYYSLTLDNKISDKKFKAFIAMYRADAAAQYDAFVLKLVGKVGPCISATLDGNHVWGYSILTVTKTNTTERWKTQQIVNTSKLGKLFNQWPSRRMK